MTSDQSAGQDNRARALTRDLRALGRLDARDEAFGRDLRARLLAQARQQTAQHDERIPHMDTTTTLARPRPVRTTAPRWPRRMRLRVASVAAAVLLALSGFAGYLRWQAPTPVSAQTVLRHTAAALHPVAADRVVHDVSTVHTVNAPGVNAGVSGISANTTPDVTVESWTQWDAAGAVARDDTAIFGGTSTAGPLLQRSVQTGLTTKLYSAQSNTTVVMTATPGPAQPQVIPNPFDTASLRRFVLDAQQGKNGEARLMPQQKLDDGTTVDVVQVAHTERVDPRADAATAARQFTVTLYVDADTYVIRKMDLTGVNAKGSLLTSSTVRVVSYKVVPASAVPPTVFSLRAPAGARVIEAPHRL